MSRPRGFAPWNPQAKSRAIIAQVEEVLSEYQDQLPLTVRQVFYRLVGAHGYAKTELAYNRLAEKLVRARRAGMIPFEAIRDDGATEAWPSGFHGLPGFWRAIRERARTYRRDRLADQPVALEVWAEAAGMVPQLARVAGPYGVPVLSSSGFDSLTVKHAAAERFVHGERHTVVLSIGDLDPSGVSIFEAAAEDVLAFVEGSVPVEFVRVAVTREQAERYDLPSSPAKSTDRRSAWRDGDETVQAEALSPADLASELDEAIRGHLDLDRLDETRELEADERARLTSRVEELLAAEEDRP